MRNGDIGPGTDRFVTVGELGKVGVDNTALLASDGNARADPSSSLPNSLQLQNGARNLAALEDSVRSSAFFTALRTRIERLAQRGAQIKQEEQETLKATSLRWPEFRQDYRQKSGTISFCWSSSHRSRPILTATCPPSGRSKWTSTAMYRALVCPARPTTRRRTASSSSLRTSSQ